MKRLLTACLVAATMAAAGAATTVNRQVFFKGDKMPLFRAGERMECVMYPFERNGKKVANGNKAAKAADTAGVTVTFKTEFNEDDYYAYPLSIINEETMDGSHAMFLNGEAVMEDVVPGKYLIFYTFLNESRYDFPRWMFVIKEGVEITSDMEIIADPTEACNVIPFTSLLPDGSEPSLPVDLENTGMSDKYDWSNATAKEVGAYTQVFNPKYGLLSQASTNIVADVPGTSQSLKGLGIAVNEVGEDWGFSQCRSIQTIDDAYYITSSTVSGVHTVPPVNDLQYTKFDYKFADNPVTEELGREDYYYSHLILPVLDGLSTGMGFWSSSAFQVPSYYLSEAKTLSKLDFTNDYYLQVQKIEMEYSEEHDGWFMDVMAGVESMPVIYDPASQDVVFAMAGAGIHGSPIWWNAFESNRIEVIPGNTSFATSAANTILPMGYTAPINNLMLVARDYDDPYPFMEFSYNYIGIYGENRDADKHLGTAYIITEDGEETMVEMTQTGGALNELSQAGKLTKPFTIEMANDRNILVDGILGKNITTQYYAAPEISYYGPTATMLQFRNSAGEVTNSFESAEGCEMLLSGGDFNYSGENEGWELAPVELKVEYAPAGSNDFKELKMIEEPDNTFMPSYGYFWKADLSVVEGKSEKGWYQVRISMEDGEGNKQTQLIYPAFQVLEYSGIENISTADNNGKTEYFNLQGHRVANPQEGVFIKVCDGKSEKIFIKK